MMLDRFLNPTPTFYKWDKFWVGFIPAVVTPLLGVVGLYLITFLNSKYNYRTEFTPHMFIASLQSKVAFMRISTVCCMLNGFVFFFFVKKDYYNAARGVMLITMLFVLAILVKELL